MALSISAVPPGQRATAMGVYQALYSIGILAGPVVGGVVADVSGLSSVFYMSAGRRSAGRWPGAGAGPPSGSKPVMHGGGFSIKSSISLAAASRPTPDDDEDQTQVSVLSALCIGVRRCCISYVWGASRPRSQGKGGLQMRVNCCSNSRGGPHIAHRAY